MTNFTVISKSYNTENYRAENPLGDLVTHHYDWVQVNQSLFRRKILFLP